MIFGCSFFPLFSVTAILEFSRDAVCVSVCNEAAVLILGLDIAVNILHKKMNLKVNPLVEDLLGIVNRESCQV